MIRRLAVYNIISFGFVGYLCQFCAIYHRDYNVSFFQCFVYLIWRTVISSRDKSPFLSR